jgi:hypothetical protein
LKQIEGKRIFKKASNNSFIDPIFAAPISSLEFPIISGEEFGRPSSLK